VLNIILFPIENLLILGITCGVISLTLTRAHFFEWLRNFIVNLCNLINEKFAIQINKLVHCHYCTGHWISLFLVIYVSRFDGPVHFLVSWFSVTAVSVLFSSIVNYLLEKSK
jgi:hypothetical protein